MASIYRTLLILLVSYCLEILAASEPSPVQPVYSQVRQLKGFDAILKCVIPDKEATFMSWTKQSQEVKENERITIFKSANSTARSTSLRIRGIKSDDFGDYVCHASISNKTYSATIKLKEKKKDSIVRPVEKNIRVDLNKTAELKCLLPKDATSINWLKNGDLLKTDKHHEILRSSSDKFRATMLKITSIEQADYGMYECTAKVSGKNQSAIIKLTDKKGQPPVEASQVEVKGALGSNVILKCNLAKNPSSVNWLKNGAKLKSDEHHTIVKYSNKNNKLTSTTLNFKKLVADDFATYQCEAVVSGKSYTASVKLIEKK